MLNFTWDVFSKTGNVETYFGSQGIFFSLAKFQTNLNIPSEYDIVVMSQIGVDDEDSEFYGKGNGN